MKVNPFSVLSQNTWTSDRNPAKVSEVPLGFFAASKKSIVYLEADRIREMRV